MTEQVPLVRDVDPLRLLGAHPPGHRLQPYLPRDVDGVLDRALVSPGLVLVVHESSSGARRAVYEALLRTRADRQLVVLHEASDNVLLGSPSQAVLWVDLQVNRSDVQPVAHVLRRWLEPDRDAVLIVNLNRPGLTELRKLLDELELNPKVVEISNRLSEAERSAAQLRNEASATVDDLISVATGDPATASIRHTAGYHADTDGGQDWLGFSQDVHMLADLVVSRHVRPPLSIGLFGNWGTGKSFFMRQMRARVRILADAAADEEQRTGQHGPIVSTYCSSVRQITFNAWHYAEANLWASLATHIFDNLATADSEDVLRRRIVQLSKLRHSEQSLLTKLSTARLERMLLAAKQDTRPLDLTGEDLLWVAQEMGVPEATTNDVRQFATKARGLGVELRQTWQLVRQSPFALLMCGLGLALAGTLWLLVRSPAWSVFAGLVSLAAGAVPAMSRVSAAAARIRRAAESSPRERKLAELDEEIAQLERAVGELATHHEMTAFARSRHESDDYRQHLGIVSLLRRDLETFAAIINDEYDAGGLERIVLYIDDLDRCPPDVVIKVLEAVHLLVALPVFVVVVAVDPRWLHQAIQLHYAAMLPDDGLTPTHYLEKIFQIPFQLPAMDQTGFVRLVRALSTQNTVDTTVPPPAATLPPEFIPVVTERDEPDPTVGFAPMTAPGSSARPELQPRQLEISDVELEFMSRLTSLVVTPRAAKRLVNLYRLVRARLPERDIEWFVAGGKYRAVLALLALHAVAGAAALNRIESEADLSWLNEHIGVNLPVAQYRQWLPLVRRFSFRG